MSEFLIVGDVDHIQDYVFGSSRLRAIRGASVLLDQAAEYVMDVLKTSTEVLRWRGGQIVVRLVDVTEDQAEHVCITIEKTFRDHSKGEATITTAYEPYGGSLDFLRAVGAAFRKVQTEKNGRKISGSSGEALLSSPYDRRCDSLPSQAAAGRKEIGGGEDRIMSYAALARWTAVEDRYRSPFDTDLKQKLSEAGIPDGYKLPYQPEDLWEKKGEGQYIGLVMADGNSFGQMLETIDDPSVYKEFSEQLYQLTLTAVAQAAKKTGMESFFKEGDCWLPLIPIILAGDDLAVLVRAEHAVVFAEGLCQQFHCLSGDRALYPAVRKVISDFRQQGPLPGERLFPGDDEEQWRLTLSAGVAIAKQSFPISALHRFAGELRASAKRGLRRHAAAVKQRGMIDFAIITTATVQPLDDLRRAFRFDESPQEPNESSKEWTCLTARPYTVDQFGHLRLLATTLKKQIPRSHRKFLYRELFNGRRAGKEAFWFVLFRQRPETVKGVLDRLRVLGGEGGKEPFREDGVTPLVDALELAELEKGDEENA